MNELVLLVDDDPVNLKRAQLILAKEGFRIAATLSGKQAFSFLSKNRPDIIFLDINMPEMDGFEVLERLKGDDGLRPIPVVLLSADTDEAVRERGLALGAAGFLGKPFLDTEVRECIYKILAKD